MRTNTRETKFHYMDIHGRELFVSRTKNDNISFRLYHDKIVEGTTRQEFQDIPLMVPSNTEGLYSMVSAMYERAQDKTVASEDPIRDGRNFMYLIKSGEAFYMMFNHDLANELRRPSETNVELSGRYISDLFDEHIEKGLAITKKLPQ